MRLKKRDRCPIHGGYFCCGREQKVKVQRHTPIRGPVTRVPDEHHPRGYRELCSPAEYRRRVLLKAEVQQGCCFYCGKEFEDARDIQGDHRRPRSAGGAWRDDSLDNLVACHGECNEAKGSRHI